LLYFIAHTTSLPFPNFTDQLTTKLTPFIGYAVQINTQLSALIIAVFSPALPFHAKEFASHSAPCPKTKLFIIALLPDHPNTTPFVVWLSCHHKTIHPLKTLLRYHHITTELSQFVTLFSHPPIAE
jgi:hypothetical protein